eukprot:XP_002527841.3 putative disease resistance protein RGA1 [Ricinus communis]
MAEAVLFNIADGIIAKLGSVVLQEIRLWWGVKEELEKLKGTVSLIKAVLLDAEEQSMESNQVKIWLGMLKEMPSPSHDAIGKENVAKCKGVPLAIRTIGGLLYFKDAESEWLPFKNKELSKVDQSLYPKDWNIKVEQVIQCWIAQGYVKSSEDANHCLEDIGAEYFMDLLQRSFFQEVEKDEYDLSHLRIKAVPRSIYKLRHLRYLNLSWKPSIKTLPDSVTKLQNLQALKLEAANLREKQHLQKLTLDYGSSSEDDDDGAKNMEKYETALGALQSHQNLKELNLTSYWGLKSPSWLYSLLNLVSIGFFYCKNMQRLPPFDHFPSLKSLRIYKLMNLEYADTGLHMHDRGSASFYPSLTDLDIHDCPKLKGFMGSKTDVGMTSLSSSSLVFMPHFPSLEELTLGTHGLKALKNILEMATSLSQSASSLSPSTSPFSALSQLKRLQIMNEINDLSDLPKLLQNLTSLQHLEFYNFETLSIDENDDGMQWQGLKSLHSFTVKCIENLESLPNGLLYVTALRSLNIHNCPNIKSLPEWTANLTSIQYLSISFCPQLAERCKTNVAEDWLNILNSTIIFLLKNFETNSIALVFFSPRRMAEAVLFNIADGIIAKLGSVILQEIGLWWGVKEELDKLNGTVSTIKTVLLHAEEQSLETPPVKYWLGRLKEAIYDADDLLDEFSTEASRQQMMTGNRISKEVRLLCSGSNKFAYGLKMAHKIKDMSNKLEKIAADRRFLLEERPRETLNVSRGSREQTHSSAPDVVVGREHDKEAIIELLLSSINEDNVSVIPIIGIGGLGKTTLAQCVYNDERVKTHFELKAWACISDNFEVQKTVRKIIESASGKNPEISEMEALKNLLHDRINGKKFLIVLDDLWSDDAHKWFRLKDLLAGGASGSKIVITTRLRKVAEMTRPVSIHELEGLSEIESWSLFKQIAFKRGQLPSPSHEAIGKEIVAKCKGAPLAIRTIAGILYFKDAESEWEAFKNKELSKVDQGENDILPTLRLSYNYLPSHYKHCFAYCSLYPKDCNIKVEELIQCWIAQGYVKSSEDANHCLQDIGAEYFTDLFQRSFFQEVKKDTYGNIYTCKMHDLMHDLAVSVAGEDCDLLNSEMACTISDKTLHISLKLDGNFRLQAFPSLLKANKLRSLLLKALVLRVPNIKEEEIHVLFCSLRCLRVLDLSDLGIKSVPCSIYKLRHLRYLNLSKNRPIKTLPDSITKLQNLQVLNLQECASLKQLPKDIEKLVNLWHLNIDGCYGLSHMPRGIGKLTCLQKLSKYFVAEDNFFKNLSWQSAGLGELNALNNLRGGLMIENLRCVKNAAFECKAANLKEKQHLQRLKLDWSRYGHGDDREKDEKHWKRYNRTRT